MYSADNIAVFCPMPSPETQVELLSHISKKHRLILYTELKSLSDKHQYYLSCSEGKLAVSPVDSVRGGALMVDFDSPQASYRRQSSGIKQEIAKAVGCKSDNRPNILDITAGLGGDAFVLASLGCKLTLIEKNPIVYELLLDGLLRGSEGSSSVSAITSENITLLPCQNAITYIENKAESFEVVYLDPMFPQRSKAAKVKKAMQYFHDIVGLDLKQEDALLKLSLNLAEKRVVVKRPKQAPLLANMQPSHQIKSKTIRYDVYIK